MLCAFFFEEKLHWETFILQIKKNVGPALHNFWRLLLFLLSSRSIWICRTQRKQVTTLNLFIIRHTHHAVQCVTAALDIHTHTSLFSSNFLCLSVLAHFTWFLGESVWGLGDHHQSQKWLPCCWKKRNNNSRKASRGKEHCTECVWKLYRLLDLWIMSRACLTFKKQKLFMT